jgi:hypothetical protein
VGSSPEENLVLFLWLLVVAVVVGYAADPWASFR